MSEQPPDWATAVPSTAGVHPSGTDATQFVRPDFLLKLPNFFAYLVENIIGVVLKALTGGFLGGPLGSAFSQLTNWAEVLLPDMILDPIRQLVNILISALNLIPIFGPVAGNVVEYMANIFGLLNDNTTAAQDTADTAQETADTAQGTANGATADAAATLATSEVISGGALIIDSFNGTAANNLGANWTQTYESGSGLLGIDGNGNARWYQSGSGSRYCRATYNAASLTTDLQKAQVVINVKFPGYLVNPEIWILLRGDGTGNNYVAARLYDGGCEIGRVVSGAYTRMGSAVAVTHAAGDTWAFCVGTAADDYRFRLFQNANLRVDQTDSGHVSQKGSSYRKFEVRVRAGAQSIGWVTKQQAHPPMAVVTAIDYAG